MGKNLLPSLLEITYRSNSSLDAAVVSKLLNVELPVVHSLEARVIGFMCDAKPDRAQRNA